jgi:hypothetical protein
MHICSYNNTLRLWCGYMNDSTKEETTLFSINVWLKHYRLTDWVNRQSRLLPLCAWPQKKLRVYTNKQAQSLQTLFPLNPRHMAWVSNLFFYSLPSICSTDRIGLRHDAATFPQCHWGIISFIFVNKPLSYYRCFIKHNYKDTCNLGFWYIFPFLSWNVCGIFATFSTLNAVISFGPYTVTVRRCCSDSLRAFRWMTSVN